MGLTIGVDIGGTKVAAGVVDESGKVIEQTRRDTPAHDSDGAVEAIVEVIHELSKSHVVEAVGVGAAGWIDADRTTVLFAPNLAWRDEPLRERVAHAVGLPVLIENDGNTAAWAEFRFGAGRGVDDSMVLFTIGTGVGGGLIIDGEVLRGSHGIAGEIGHARSVPDGHHCRCGRRGCLEQYASGSALVRFAREAAENDPGSAGLLLEMSGGAAKDITGPMVTRAAMAGDAAAVAAFEQVGYWLGPALADVVQVVDPQVLVIGGGVAEAGDLLLSPAERSYRQALAERGRLPVAEVRLAVMGNAAGLIGAADLAREHLSSTP